MTQAIETIKQILGTNIHQDVRNHYTQLVEALVHPEFRDFRVLIFNPVAIGDNVVVSLGAELLKKKFSGCTVDFLTAAEPAVPLLRTNPFIDKVICDQNWELYKTRDTRYEKVNGCPSKVGTLLKQYDLGYSLYWWSPPMIDSFLSDMELPTDYKNVKVYIPEHNRNKAMEYLRDTKGFRICLQKDINTKWDGSYENLKNGLSAFGEVIEIGKITGNYLESAAILEQSDLCVCAEGSITIVASGVGCPTLALSTVYNPEDVNVSYYQNKYQPKNKQHRVIRPKNWCKDYHCISYNIKDSPHKDPPYGFSSEGRFPPFQYKHCDYDSIKTTCVREISVGDILEQVDLHKRAYVE